MTSNRWVPTKDTSALGAVQKQIKGILNKMTLEYGNRGGSAEPAAKKQKQ